MTRSEEKRNRTIWVDEECSDCDLEFLKQVYYSAKEVGLLPVRAAVQFHCSDDQFTKFIFAMNKRLNIPASSFVPFVDKMKETDICIRSRWDDGTEVFL